MASIVTIPLNKDLLFSNFPNESELRKYYDALGIDELEVCLKQAIAAYRSRQKRGSGYRALEADIEQKLYQYLEGRGYAEIDIEKIVQKRVPKQSYIQKFCNGTNICINYMNTLAFFFDIKYLVNNFDFE